MTDAPTPIGPYTPVVRAGDLLVCSGQLGLVDGRLVDGVGAQTSASVANIASLLEGMGARLDDVVKTTVFLLDMARFEEMNAAYLEAFSGHRPARTAVAVRALPLGGSVEIEAWAYHPAS